MLLPLALPAPYDYAVPEGMTVAPGQFVVAPLSTVDYLGVVWPRDESAEPPKLDPKKLREIIEVVDDVPPLPRVSLDFADWVARYTLSSPGMVLRMMMSAGRAFSPPAPRYGVRLLEGSAPSRMTPARARVLEVAGNGMTWAKSALAEAAGVSTGVIDGLVDAGTLITEELPAWAPPQLDLSTARARLTPEQADAAGELLANMSDGFSVTLLDGVTGSGKTEVYFEAIAATLAQGKQALVLMPEIALTSHFIARCEQRFGAKPAEWHSGLSAPLRGRVWRAVAENQAKLVVGARSALFLPFPDLGLIVVDEEHDAGYKQEERVTYQARDMAVLRGSLGQFPVVLSSATPSIESLVNASQGRYRHIKLEQRYKAARLPDIAAIDMRVKPARARQMAVAGSGRGGRRDFGARRAGACCFSIAAAMRRSPYAGTAASNSNARIALPGWSSTAFAGGSNATIAEPSRRFPRSARIAAPNIRSCRAGPASSASTRRWQRSSPRRAACCFRAT